MKFNGASGRRPSAEARRYIYEMLATSLQVDIDNAAGWTCEDDDLSEEDVRRIRKEAPKVIRELLVKAGLRAPRKRPLDWARIEANMLKSFRGAYVSAQGGAELQRAYDQERAKYGETHRRMKKVEQERIRNGG